MAFSFLPFIVLSRDYAMQISEDLQFAVIHQEAGTVRFFQDVFSRLLDACIPMTMPVNDYRDLLFIGNHRTAGHAPVSFQMYPNMNYFITEDLLEKYLHPDLPERQFLIRAALEIGRRELSYVTSVPSTILVSEKGLQNFMESGTIPGIPSFLHIPLDPADRLFLLRRYIEMVSSPSVFFRIVKEDFGNTSSGASVWIEDSAALILLTCTDGNKKCLFARDPDLLFSFRDFFLHMGEDLCLDEKESLQILNDIAAEWTCLS